MGDRDWAPRAILSENICEYENRYVQDSLDECYRLARTLRKVLISLELLLAHSSRVLRAVRIALERAEVRRPIPRRSIQRVEEGRVDSKHVEDLSRHLECTRIMLMAPCAKIPMLSKKSPRVSKVKSRCTREFAVSSEAVVDHRHKMSTTSTGLVSVAMRSLASPLVSCKTLLHLMPSTFFFSFSCVNFSVSLSVSALSFNFFVCLQK